MYLMWEDKRKAEMYIFVHIYFFVINPGEMTDQISRQESEEESIVLRRRDIRSGTSVRNPVKSISIGQCSNLP